MPSMRHPQSIEIVGDRSARNMSDQLIVAIIAAIAAPLGSVGGAIASPISGPDDGQEPLKS